MFSFQCLIWIAQCHKSWRSFLRTRNNYKYRRRKSMGDTQAAVLESHLYWQRRRQTILKSLENMETLASTQTVTALRSGILQPGCACTTATSHSSNSSSSASCSTCPPLLHHPSISSPSLPCTCTSLREHCPPCKSRRHVPNCRPRPITQHQPSCARHQVCKNGLSATLPRNTVFHSKSVKFVGLPPSSPTASSPVSTQSFVSSRKALAPVPVSLSLTFKSPESKLPAKNQSPVELTLFSGSSTGDSQILVSQFDPALNSWSVGMKSSPHNNPPLPPRRTTMVNGRGTRRGSAAVGECRACLRPAGQALRRPPTLATNGQTADGVFRPLPPACFCSLLSFPLLGLHLDLFSLSFAFPHFAVL